MATQNKKAAAPAPKPSAARSKAGPAPKSRAWLVPVIMLAVLVAVGLGIWIQARRQAALHKDMLRESHTIPQGRDRGQAQAVITACGDKQGQTFVLEGNEAVPPRLQRFDAEASVKTVVYKPTRVGQDLNGAVDMDSDAAGNVYVLLKDGRVQVLDNELRWLRTIKTGLVNPEGLSVNSQGRIYLALPDDNKVVFFDAKGRREGDIAGLGAGGLKLASPVRLRVAAGDELVVMERTDLGLRGRILTAEHKLRKTFEVKDLKMCPPVKLAVNADNLAFFNDHMGSRGVVFYDISSGNFAGESQATKDGEKFINPGAIGADRFTRSVYVHTVTGLIKCQLPEEAQKAEPQAQPQPAAEGSKG